MIGRRGLLFTLAAWGALLIPGRPGFGQGQGSPPGGGIGGTGKSAQGGGIGGTGIVGTLTEFGSIWVNGIEVEILADAKVALEDRAGTVDDLFRGQVVAVRAAWSRQFQIMQAKSVAVRYQVAGPVADGNVLGQTVVWPKGVAAPKAGEWVAVSGLRRADGVVVASRVDGWSAPQGWLLRGTLTRRDGGLALSGLELPARHWGSDLYEGRGARASGPWRGGRPQVEAVTADPLNPFGAQVGTLTLEVVADPQGRLPAGVDLPQGAGRPRPNQHLVVDGRPKGDGFVAERILGAPDVGQRGLPEGMPVTRRFQLPEDRGRDDGGSMPSGRGGSGGQRGGGGSGGGGGGGGGSGGRSGRPMRD